ncbi:hypothetical protein L1987_57726 [Smallanthus sonchifolius]|uniref:Uncharacterized protein n=1 Tax=Smallanthus sonchifolius TaxID=185202 RepID=A0ACB9DDC1_9ASTR|nr:hypothetical protein L1987_57726 [Smallanthus sonchifolius]
MKKELESWKLDMLHEFEVKKKELETELKNREIQFERHIHEREKSFADKIKREMASMKYLKDIASREMEKLKLDRARLGKENMMFYSTESTSKTILMSSGQRMQDSLHDASILAPCLCCMRLHLYLIHMLKHMSAYADKNAVPLSLLSCKISCGIWPDVAKSFLYRPLWSKYFDMARHAKNLSLFLSLLVKTINVKTSVSQGMNEDERVKRSADLGVRQAPSGDARLNFEMRGSVWAYARVGGSFYSFNSVCISKFDFNLTVMAADN